MEFPERGLNEKNQTPGWSTNDDGRIDLEACPNFKTYDFRKDGPSSANHYRITRASEQSPWKLQKASSERIKTITQLKNIAFRNRGKIAVMKPILIPAFTLLILGACIRGIQRHSHPLCSLRPNRLQVTASTNMDLSMDPGKDFFDYANGGWFARNPIPASESGWGIGSLVNEELYAKLRKINEQAAASRAKQGTDEQQIGDFWITAMDEAKADALGITPLNRELALIDSIKTAKDVLDVSFALCPVGVGAFCSVSVSQDEKQSDLMSVHISQGGLGLPDRDFYFNPEKGTAEIRKAYVGHLSRMFKLMGRSDRDSLKAAKNVMKFETALAKASRKLEDLRDPEKNYNKMSPRDLTAKRTPLIAWDQRAGGDVAAS